MPHFSTSEERLNVWSHAVGILLAIGVGSSFLRMSLKANIFWAIAGISLYFFGMTASYLSSTCYHAFLPGRTKCRLRQWDHAAIYWHIAGSYSPITLLALREIGYWGWGLFLFIWGCASVGTIMSFRKLREHSHVETACFVLMGMSILVAFKPLINVVSTEVIVWIIAEGVCYLVGAFFYSMQRKYMHSVFHFFVLAGSICHIMAVYHVLQTYL